MVVELLYFRYESVGRGLARFKKMLRSMVYGGKWSAVESGRYENVEVYVKVVGCRVFG